MNKFFLFLSLVLLASSLKVKKELEYTTEGPTVFDITINEHPCCDKKPLGPEDADPCPDAPIKGGKYHIVPNEADDLAWNFDEEKVALDKKKMSKDSEIFELILGESCKYTIKGETDILQPHMFCTEEQIQQTIEIKEGIPLDLLFMIDSTHSMDGAIRDVQLYTKKIVEEINEKLGEMDVKFGAVCYRDPTADTLVSGGVIYKGGQTDVFDFTDEIADFQKFIDKEEAKDGADAPEDWVGAYTEAKKLSWRNGVRLIIQIGDAPAHGVKWAGTGKESKKDTTYNQLEGLTVDFCDMKKTYITALQIKSEELLKKGYDSSVSWNRMQTLCMEHRKANGNPNEDFLNILPFDQDETDPSYFTDIIVNATKEAVKKSKKTCGWGIGLPVQELTATEWDIIKEDDGAYKITPVGKELYAHVQDGKFEKGSPIVLDDLEKADLFDFVESN